MPKPMPKNALSVKTNKYEKWLGAMYVDNRLTQGDVYFATELTKNTFYNHGLGSAVIKVARKKIMNALNIKWSNIDNLLSRLEYFGYIAPYDKTRGRQQASCYYFTLPKGSK